MPGIRGDEDEQPARRRAVGWLLVRADWVEMAWGGVGLTE